MEFVDREDPKKNRRGWKSEVDLLKRVEKILDEILKGILILLLLRQRWGGNFLLHKLFIGNF